MDEFFWLLFFASLGWSLTSVPALRTIDRVRSARLRRLMAWQPWSPGRRPAARQHRRCAEAPNTGRRPRGFPRWQRPSGLGYRSERIRHPRRGWRLDPACLVCRSGPAGQSDPACRWGPVGWWEWIFSRGRDKSLPQLFPKANEGYGMESTCTFL